MKAKASHGRFTAEAKSTRKHIFSCELDQEEYLNLINRLRKLDEAHLFTASISNCIEPFKILIRVKDKEKLYFGCRGTGANSTLVSKLARQLQFLLIQHTSR
jgi:hypothetical protein